MEVSLLHSAESARFLEQAPHGHAPGFTSREFRDALGRFATGVTIVTTYDVEGQRVGLTVSSFNALSLVPPLVSWSLALTSRSYPAFSASRWYVVNVLAESQCAVAEAFASRREDRFSKVPFRSTPSGVVIEGAVAVFECFNRRQYVEGDHVLFVGEVKTCQRNPHEAPLLFMDGQLQGSKGV
jgi:flavin reductase (DIM6/NTAB) family NADH-FMN oxidoreductase RutF